MTANAIRLVLASASPARLRTLRQAGLWPEVVVSGVDESAVESDSVPSLVAELARLKAESVADRLASDETPTVVMGCDSMLDLDGTALGKPGSTAEAVKRWRRMTGRSAVLHTGHHVIMKQGAGSSVR